MRVTVSGLPGSGTTSLANLLAKSHSYDLISAGEVFRQMAAERNMDLTSFGRLAREDPAFDRMIDERQKEIAMEHDNIIIEGRLSAWFVPEADLRVWLFAPMGTRVRRIFARDSPEDMETAAKVTKDREKCESDRYKSFYGIDINDLSPYHLVLNSEYWSVDELGSVVVNALEMVQNRSCANPL